MAVYYKFKSAKNFDSIPMDGHFMPVESLKERIFEIKLLGMGNDFDLVITNAQTNEEYLDEMLIPRNTSVLVRRVPGRPQLPIVTEQGQEVGNKVVETEPENGRLPSPDTSAMKYPEDSDWDDFGRIWYSIPDQVPVQSNILIPEGPPTNKTDEDSRIKALVDTPALNWQRQGSDFGFATSFGRGMGRRMGAGRGFGFMWKRPPQGYVCHRCNMPGHFIQYCPTNGDPKYDIQRVKQPTGIPKSMLMVNQQGSYALPNGSVAVLEPNDAAFEKEMQGLPSMRSVGDLQPGFRCTLCKHVLKDAVLTSKCCYRSFCDKCIRDYVISKSMCVCGTTDVLADDLKPNMTLRDAINSVMESGNYNFENAGNSCQVQEMESKAEQKVSPINEGTTNIQETAYDRKAVSATQQTSEQVRIPKADDVSEATHESMRVKEPASQVSAQQVEEEMEQKLVPTEAGKKKKRKKVHMPINDLQWKTPDDLGDENHMMPMGPPPGYNSYWNDMQPCMYGFMPSYGGATQMMGYGGYGPSPLDMAFASGLPQDPLGMQGYMMPAVPSPRDLADFSMGVNAPPPVMSREEFEARRDDLRRKPENERRGERYLSNDRKFGKDREYEYKRHHHHRHRSEYSSKMSSLTVTGRNEKKAGISHKSLPIKEEASKKRKVTFSIDRKYDKDGEYEYEQHHLHYRRSGDLSKMSSSPVNDHNLKKAGILSRKSFPAKDEASKKKKVTFSTNREYDKDGEHEYERHQHHRCRSRDLSKMPSSPVTDHNLKKAGILSGKSSPAKDVASKKKKVTFSTDREYDKDGEYEYERHHHHRCRSRDLSKMSSSSVTDHNPKKAGILSCKSSPAKGEASKKKKVTFSNDREFDKDGEYYERHHHHRHRSEYISDMSSSTATNRNPKKAGILSCKSFPANDKTAKKRKVTFSDDQEFDKDGEYEYEWHHHHRHRLGDLSKMSSSAITDCNPKKAGILSCKSSPTKDEASKKKKVTFSIDREFDKDGEYEYERHDHHRHQSEYISNKSSSTATDRNLKQTVIFSPRSFSAKKEASKKRKVTLSSMMETTTTTAKGCGV